MKISVSSCGIFQESVRKINVNFLKKTETFPSFETMLKLFLYSYFNLTLGFFRLRSTFIHCFQNHVLSACRLPDIIVSNGTTEINALHGPCTQKDDYT